MCSIWQPYGPRTCSQQPAGLVYHILTAKHSVWLRGCERHLQFLSCPKDQASPDALHLMIGSHSLRTVHTVLGVFLHASHSPPPHPSFCQLGRAIGLPAPELFSLSFFGKLRTIKGRGLSKKTKQKVRHGGRKVPLCWKVPPTLLKSARVDPKCLKGLVMAALLCPLSNEWLYCF